MLATALRSAPQAAKVLSGYRRAIVGADLATASGELAGSVGRELAERTGRPRRSCGRQLGAAARDRRPGGRFLPARARSTALLLSGARADAVETGDSGVQLLADVRAVFANNGIDKATTKALLSALGDLEGPPWAEWNRGRPLTPRQFRTLLGRFGIEPGTIRVGDGRRRDGARHDARTPGPRPQEMNMPTATYEGSPAEPVTAQTSVSCGAPHGHPRQP
jgi:hypothetical protein